MRLKSKTVVGLVAGCSALAFSAAPASAAPLTVKTDAGTTCTVNADYTLGAGLLVRPIDFKGTIGCSPANSANVPTASSQLVLTSSAPLGLGGAGGRPNKPQATVPAPPGFPAGEFAYKCDVAPNADCSFSGRSTGIPTGTYQVIFSSGLVAPKGETWTGVPEGCRLSEDGSVACTSFSAKFTTN